MLFWENADHDAFFFVIWQSSSFLTYQDKWESRLDCQSVSLTGLLLNTRKQNWGVLKLLIKLQFYKKKKNQNIYILEINIYQKWLVFTQYFYPEI